MRIVSRKPISTGQRLKELINERGITQAQLAESVKVPTKTISHWVNDQVKNIRMDNLQTLADFFDVDVGHLTCGQVERQKNDRSSDNWSAFDDKFDIEALSKAVRLEEGWNGFLEAIDCKVSVKSQSIELDEVEYTVIENGELITLADSSPQEKDFLYTVTLPGGSTVCFQESQWKQIQNEIAEYTLFKLTKADIKKNHARRVWLKRKRGQTMATIKKRGGSYLFRCYDGYDENGRQIERTMTWKPPAGMSEKKADKEAQHEAALFEERVRTGQAAEKKIKFSEFTKKWFEDYAEIQLRPRTVARYHELMQRIDPAIGHLYLDKLRPAHLMAFYKELSTTPKVETYRAKVDFKQYLKNQGLTQEAFSKSAGVSLGAIHAVNRGENISEKNANKIADALNQQTSSLFEPAGEAKMLSSKTVLHYHRLISSILHTAVEWQYIPANPAERVKPPKVQTNDALYLDDKQAIELLELIQSEPIQYRTASI